MIVLWRVTQHCNLACGFCAYDRRLPGARLDADAADVERVVALLAEHRESTGERVLLSWLGGEPLLWRPLFDVSRRLRREHGIDISATTNGSTLHRPDVVDAVLYSFCELTVSVDGLQTFHDGVRGRTGAWQKLSNDMRRLAQARQARTPALKLRVNVVLMRDNVGEFAALCRELADWGIDEITFNQLGGRDRPEFFAAHRLRLRDVQAMQALLPDLVADLARGGVRLCTEERYLRRFEASAEGVPMPVEDCLPGERLLFIDEFGRIAPCSFTNDIHGMPAAQVPRPHGLQSLPVLFRAARAEAPAAACRDCHATHVSAKFASCP